MGYIYFIGKFNLPIKVGNDAGDDAKEVFEDQTPLVRKVIPAVETAWLVYLEHSKRCVRL